MFYAFFFVIFTQISEQQGLKRWSKFINFVQN